MIKLERGECPKELTKEVISELTEIYKQDREKDVWNNPRIKKPLKEALMSMSYNKCAYCECELGIESKDVTIDHFKPKLTNSHIVVKWDNLLPACLRCNRTKNRKENKIINPCLIEPKEHIGVKNSRRCRMKAKDVLGRETIKVLGLNDIERVIAPRNKVCDKLIELLEALAEDIADEGIKDKYIDRLEKILCECQKDYEYSAIKATNVLNDETYITIKEKFILKDKWNVRLRELENELNAIKFDIL